MKGLKYKCDKNTSEADIVSQINNSSGILKSVQIGNIIYDENYIKTPLVRGFPKEIFIKTVRVNFREAIYNKNFQSLFSIRESYKMKK